MTEHVLWEASDFDDADDHVRDGALYRAVVEGGLGVCKLCGAYEQDLVEHETCESYLVERERQQ